MPLTAKTYLADGVYAAFDGYHVVLTTENGIRATNTIYLDENVIEALRAYFGRIAALRKGPKPEED